MQVDEVTFLKGGACKELASIYVIGRETMILLGFPAFTDFLFAALNRAVIRVSRDFFSQQANRGSPAKQILRQSEAESLDSSEFAKAGCQHQDAKAR